VKAIIEEAIDDPMVVNLVVPMLMSLSDDELRGYMFKVGKIIADCLDDKDSLPHSSEFPCSDDPCKHVIIQNSNDSAAKKPQRKRK